MPRKKRDPKSAAQVRKRLGRIWSEVEKQFSHNGLEARTVLHQAKGELFRRVDNDWATVTEKSLKKQLSDMELAYDVLKEDNNKVKKKLSVANSLLEASLREWKFRIRVLCFVAAVGWLTVIVVSVV